MVRPRDPGVASKQEYCPICRATTEWRFNKVGFDANGVQRHRWRCVPCRNRQYLQREDQG